MDYPHLPHITFLMNALGEIKKPDKKTLETLGRLYEIKKLTIDYIINNKRDDVEPFISADYELGTQIIKPNLIINPNTIQLDNDKLEKNYTVFGHGVTFKVDTGAVTNVIDAVANWECSDEDLFLYSAAYKEYVKLYPDDGAMRQTHLKKLSPQYHHLNFGYVDGFDLKVHRKGKDSDMGQAEENHRKTKTVHIDRVYKVIGITSPSKDSKMGETPFPVIRTVLKDPNTGKNIQTTIALKPRNMTIRGLLGRVFVNKHDITLLPESNDNKILDLDKLHLEAVNEILQSAYPPLTPAIPD